jgi:HEAT repeat protein
MIKLTSAFIDSLLLQQDIEFRSDFAVANNSLHSTVTEADEIELLAAGRREIRSEDPRRRILGVRLIRELKHYSQDATAEIGRMLTAEPDPEVMYWVVGAFGFLKSDSVADRLRGLASHPSPGVRYNVATALANCASAEMPSDSVDTLLDLARDRNAEVRFSATFELGTWWPVSHDPRIESALRRAIDTDNDAFVVRAARDAIQEGNGQ